MQILSLINDYNGFLAIIDVWTLNLKHSCELQQSQTETTIKKKWWTVSHDNLANTKMVIA